MTDDAPHPKRSEQDCLVEALAQRDHWKREAYSNRAVAIMFLVLWVATAAWSMFR